MTDTPDLEKLLDDHALYHYNTVATAEARKKIIELFEEKDREIERLKCEGWIKIKDENSCPKPPCNAYWNDGRQTVLDSQEDCEYAVHHLNGKHITHWQPLPEPPKTPEDLAE